MKLTLLSVLLFCFNVSAAVYAQQITLNERNAPLEKVLKQVEKQSGYTFIYENNLLVNTKPVTIRITNGTLNDVLVKCFATQPLTFSVVEQTIIIKVREKGLIQKVKELLRKPVKVSGKVVDTTGNPLAGANITINGKAISATSQSNGIFNLEAEHGDIVTVSYIGYTPNAFTVTEDLPFQTIVLHQVNNALNEVSVVSTGYQQIPKERATGAFTQIDNKTINRNIGINIIDRLEGVASGLLLNRNLPASFGANNSKISIRGRSTIFANAEPLIVLDGVPYSGTLDQINPSDIDQITLLKDAAAASIWGSKSGNGVVVLTSKKGRKNQPAEISISSTIALTAKPNLNYLPYLSATEFIDIEQSLFNSGYYDGTLQVPYLPVSSAVEIFDRKRQGLITPSDSARLVNALKTQNIRDDLRRYQYRSAVYQQYQASVSGGSGEHQYYFSSGYDKNAGSLVTDDYDRLSLTANNTYSFLKNKVIVTSAINYTNSTTKSQTEVYNPIAPYDRLADNAGNALAVNSLYNGSVRVSYADTAGGGRLLDWHYRPKDEFTPNHAAKFIQYRINTGFRYNIISGLSVNAIYQYLREANTYTTDYPLQRFYTRDLINKFSSINGEQVTSAIPRGGILDKNINEGISKLFRVQLDFERKFGTDHQVNALAGYEGNDSRVSSNSFRLYGYNAATQTNGNNLISPQTFYPYYYDPFATEQILTAPDLYSTTDISQSYYANASYTYKGRYILSGSARKDESNLFGVSSNQRGVPLWSAGASWLVSREPFYHSDLFSTLKLRASYGYNGNVDKSVSGQLTIRNTGLLNPWGQFSTEISNPPNPYLRWEKVRTWNIGLDYAIINDRVFGSLDVYQKNASDLIGNNPIAGQSGVTQYRGNGANLVSKGVELNISSRNLTGAFAWTTNLLFNYNSDKVTDYKIQSTSNSNIIVNNFSNPQVGYPYYAVFSFPSAGLSSEGKPQGYLDGAVSTNYSAISSVLDPSQLKYHGSATPLYFGSFINTVAYKQVELTFNIIYKFDYYFRRNNVFDGYTNVVESVADYGKRWQKPGDEQFTRVPAFVYPQDNGASNFFLNSEDVVEKADNIRLQDIRLSYSLAGSGKILSLVKNATFFLYARNLGILWKRTETGVDPDFGVYNYPQPLNVSFGINLKLK